MRRVVVTVLIATVFASIVSGCDVIASRLIARNHSDSCLIATFALVPDPGQVVDDGALDRVRTVVIDRLKAAGVSEAAVETEAPGTLVVRLPVSEPLDRTLGLISQRGELEVVPVPAEFADLVNDGQPLPDEINVIPLLTFKDIASARAETDATTGSSVATLVLTNDAKAAFDDFAERVYDGSQRVKLAIVLDRTVLSALALMARHFGGEIQISGSFTSDEVNRMVAFAKSGPLPVSVEIVSRDQGSCSPRG